VVWPVPYDKLDQEMVTVVRLLNETGIVKTTGCCAGHKVGQSAYIGLSLVDDGAWETRLLPAICEANAYLSDVNIEVRKRYFNREPGRTIADWCIVIEPHPDSGTYKETRRRLDRAIKRLEEELVRFVEREGVGLALRG